MNNVQTPPAKFPLELKVTTVRLQTKDNGNTPRLASMEFSPFNMDGSDFSRPQATHSSPNLFESQRSPLSSKFDHANRRITPIRAQSVITPRKTTSQDNSPTKSASEAEDSSSPITDATPHANGSPWSSAIGRAALGKSGRVIERLMADIDRLKRELNAEISHRQEVEKREEASRNRLDMVMAENANLQQGKDIDAGALRRRDRKIEELRAELQGERARRTAAERDARDATKEKEDVVVHCRKQVAETKEQAKQAEGHAQVLRQSHVQLEQDYRQETETMSEDIQTLMMDHNEDGRQVQKLDIVIEQMRHELDHANKVNERMAEVFLAYKSESESRVRSLMQKNESLLSDQALRVEMEKALKETKWLLNVTRTITTADRR